MFDGDDFPSAPIHTGGCVPRYFCECHTYVASQDESSASQPPWDEASEPGGHLGGPLPGDQAHLQPGEHAQEEIHGAVHVSQCSPCLTCVGLGSNEVYLFIILGSWIC